ncbi:unnamed protein product [Laminaria digitata]
MGSTSVAVCGVVPIAAVVPVLLAGAHRHYRGTTTVITHFVYLTGRPVDRAPRGNRRGQALLSKAPRASCSFRDTLFAARICLFRGRASLARSLEVREQFPRGPCSPFAMSDPHNTQH